MEKEDYIKIVNEKMIGTGKEIFLNQINNYYYACSYILPKHTHKVGDNVLLKKGTLLHGTYKNFEGLKEIVENGLISSWFINGRISKYPSSVGVWNLKQDYLLKDYINFYSGGTIMYMGIFENNVNTQKDKTKVIPYNEMFKINDLVREVDSHMWLMEQTKEARFLPSLVQNRVQIGIIFNTDNLHARKLLECDILNPEFINDEDVKEFVNPNYYEKFIKERKNKNDFFTDRESAVLFGIPSNLIEGIMVGKIYEKDENMLNNIKTILPNSYICNLDGIIIKE